MQGNLVFLKAFNQNFWLKIWLKSKDQARYTTYTEWKDLNRNGMHELSKDFSWPLLGVRGKAEEHGLDPQIL